MEDPSCKNWKKNQEEDPLFSKKESEGRKKKKKKKEKYQKNQIKIKNKEKNSVTCTELMVLIENST